MPQNRANFYLAFMFRKSFNVYLKKPEMNSPPDSESPAKNSSASAAAKNRQKSPSLLNESFGNSSRVRFTTFIELASNGNPYWIDVFFSSW